MKSTKLFLLLITAIFFALSAQPVLAQGNNANEKLCKLTKKILDTKGTPETDDDKGRLIKERKKQAKKQALKVTKGEKYELVKEKALVNKDAQREKLDEACFTEGATIVRGVARTKVDGASSECKRDATKDRRFAASQGKIENKTAPTVRIQKAIDKSIEKEDRMLVIWTENKTTLEAVPFNCAGVTDAPA